MDAGRVAVGEGRNVGLVLLGFVFPLQLAAPPGSTSDALSGIQHEAGVREQA